MFDSYEETINWSKKELQYRKLYHLMDSKFGIYIGQSLIRKLKFLIPGKNNTTHEFIWPNRGGISTYNAEIIINEIKDHTENFKIKIEII
jgi:hypothetical protein